MMSVATRAKGSLTKAYSARQQVQVSCLYLNDDKHHSYDRSSSRHKKCWAKRSVAANDSRSSVLQDDLQLESHEQYETTLVVKRQELPSGVYYSLAEQAYHAKFGEEHPT